MNITDYIGKVIEGDCLEVMKSMPDKCVDLVLTDPPYGMSYISSRRKQKHKPIENDNTLVWSPAFFQHCFRILKNNTHAYFFCNEYCISTFTAAAKMAGFSVKRLLVWVKNNHTSGDLTGDYGNKTEYILFVHKGRRELNGSRDTNVLQFDRETTGKHPTAKPLELCAYLIQKSTVEGEVVFDPFCGSSPSLRAAKNLGRQYIGIDIEEKYVAWSNLRLEQEVLL